MARALSSSTLKTSFFGFGIIEKKNGINFSDIEKTLLDMIRKRKVAEYLKFYPKNVADVIENTGII